MNLNKRPIISQQQKDKLFAEALKPIQCNTLPELKAMLKDLINRDSANEIQLKTKMEWNDDNKTSSSNLTTISKDTSLYSMLVDGFNLIKNRNKTIADLQHLIKEAAEDGDVIKLDDNLFNIDNQRFAVDLIIEKRLGGIRKGMRISWNLQEGIHEFDILEQRLYKVEN